MKPCPHCREVNRIGVYYTTVYRIKCERCHLSGPSKDTREEAEAAWDSLSCDIKQNQYAMRIRVKIFDVPRHGKIAEPFLAGYGWVVAIGSAPIVEHDNGKLEMISFKNLEVDKEGKA